jgi:hypothetical protein
MDEVIDPRIDVIGDAIRIAARRRSEAYRRRGRRVTLVAMAAPLLLAGGTALAGVTGVGPLADQLSAFGANPTPLDNTVPASVREVAQLEAMDAQGITPDVSGSRQIATGAPATLHAYRAGNKVCFALAGQQGAIGHCIASLDAAGEMSASLGVVDSQPYVWGAIADDVTRVTVTTNAGQVDAKLGHNGFVVPLTVASASSAITVTAFTGSGHTTTTLAPLPRASGVPSAPDAAGVSSGRVTSAGG